MMDCEFDMMIAIATIRISAKILDSRKQGPKK